MDAKHAQRALDWQRALDKLSVTFEADHEGGFPQCLKDKAPTERLDTLRSLGFRVKEQFESDNALPGDPPDMHLCGYLMGGIYVDLTEGWVHRRKRGGGD